MIPLIQPGGPIGVPTLVLQSKSGESLGAINGATEIVYKKNLNSANELSFTVPKYLDGALNPIWNSLTDLKNIWIPELEERFEIKVSFREEGMETKSITGTSLCEAELGQILLRGLEINTDQDLLYNSTDQYPTTVFYRDILSTDPPETIAQKKKHSLLHRVLSDKASFYRIGHVDSTLKNRAYTFTANGTNIYDFLTGDVAEQMQCLFQFDSMERVINVYALTDENGNEIYGKDTTILVDRENLASSLTSDGDTDSLKNCFYVEGGDEIINAAFAQVNPSGDQYLYYFSPETLAEMPTYLQNAISDYDSMSEDFLEKNPIIPSRTTHHYRAGTEDIPPCMVSGNYDSNFPDSRYVTAFQNVSKEISSLVDDSGQKPYSSYHYTVPDSFRSHEDLVTFYYNALDFQIFLEHSMMPDYKMEEYDKYQALSKLNQTNLGTIGIVGLNPNNPVEYTIKNAITNKAKTIINTALYAVAIQTSQITKTTNSQGTPTVTWTGTFSITDRQNPDSATNTITNTDYRSIAQKEKHELGSLTIPSQVRLTINDDAVAYAKNSIASMLAKKDLPTDTTPYSPEVSIEVFEKKVKFYGLSSLGLMQSVLSDCLGIVEDQIEKMESESSGLEQNHIFLKLKEYRNLYIAKQNAAAKELSKRDSQLMDVTRFLLLMEAYLAEVKKSLNFQNYLVSYGEKLGLAQNLWETFLYYKREDEYQNNYLISTNLKDNAAVISHAQKLMEFASQELETAGTLQYSISTSLDNLLALPEFAPVMNDFDVGNWIRVRMDIQDETGKEQIYKLRLLSCQINFEENSSSAIQVEFSTVTRGAKGELSDVQDILNSAQSMAKSYGGIIRQAEISSKTTETIDSWISDGLDLTNQQIMNNAKNQSLIIDESGLLARKHDPLTDTYDDCQLRILGNGIYTTHDNWNTTDAAFGKFWYKDPNNNWAPTETYGVIARKLVGEQILGEDLQISNTSGTMRFSEHGLTISNGVNTVSFLPDTHDSQGRPNTLFQITAKTPTSGGSSSSRKLLYTDTSGNLNITGTLHAEEISTASGNFSVDKNGVLHATQADISGTIHATDGFFTGTVNAIDGCFYGIVNATGGSFTGTVNATDGCFNGTVNATDGCFNGTVNATDGSFTGTINATGGTFTGDITSTGTIQGGIIKGAKINGGTIQGSTVESSTIKGATINGGSININENFKVEANGTLSTTNAKLSGDIDAKSIRAHKAYYIYNPDFHDKEPKIISYVSDETFTTEIRVGRLTKNGSDTTLNYIAFKELADTRVMHFHSDKFEFTNRAYFGSISIGGREINSNADFLKLSCVNHSVFLTNTCFRPSEDDTKLLTLGSANCLWSEIYSLKEPIVASDRNLKEQIQPISKKYEQLFDLIEPVTYKLKSTDASTHDRIHIGAISQQVEDSMLQAGLTAEELSFFCKDPIPDSDDFQYALRYTEWVMMNTHMIQKTRQELQKAEQTIAALQQEISELKASADTVNVLQQEVTELKASVNTISALQQEISGLKAAIKNLQEVN